MTKFMRALVVSFALAAGGAQAALIDRGSGLIYDTDLNVTWLQNANAGAGSTYDDGASSVDGVMTWFNAVAWAANLSYYDSVRNVVWNDWRLPNALPVNGISYDYFFAYSGTTDQGFNITSTQSELSHLFYVSFGNVGLRDLTGGYPSGEGLVDDPNNPNDESLFSNIGSAYWFGTTYEGPEPATVPFAFDFVMGGGAQSRAFKFGADHFAWAVRDGDVISAVPEPGTLALLALGLAGLAYSRGKHSQHSAGVCFLRLLSSARQSCPAMCWSNSHAAAKAARSRVSSERLSRS